MKSLILLLLTAVLLAGCGQPDSPEQIIADNLAQLEEGIEQKDPDQVLDLIHENFSTRSGADKLWIKRTMAFYMIKHTKIEIVSSGLDIEMQPESANAGFSALVTGGAGLIPEQGAIYQVETEWRLQDGDWLLVYADWSRP